MPDLNIRSWEDRQSLHDGQIPSSEPFPFSAVESEVDLLCEHLDGVNLTPVQATAVLAWHKSQMQSQEANERAFVIGRVIGELLDSRNVPMDVNALALAAGLDAAYALGSEAEVARRLGVTRAAVCKRTNMWRDTLGYSVTKFLRSEKNRQNCSLAQKKDHWRKRPIVLPTYL